MSTNLFGFDNEADFLRNIRSIIVTEARKAVKGAQQWMQLPEILYAQVTEVVSETEVKAVQKVWDTEASPNAGYVDPDGTAWKWDTDLVGSDDYALTNIQTDTPLSVDDFIEVIYYPDLSGVSFYKARVGGGGGTTLAYVEITGSANRTTYTGTVYNNPINRSLIETGVSIRAANIEAGDPLPNSAPGTGFWAVVIDDVYYIEPPTAIG